MVGLVSGSLHMRSANVKQMGSRKGWVLCGSSTEHSSGTWRGMFFHCSKLPAQCQEKQDIIQSFLLLLYIFYKESLSFTTPGTAYFLPSAAFMAYVCCSRLHNQVARAETPKIRQMCLGQKSGMSWFYWQFRSDRRLECQNHVEFWSHVLVSCPLACPFKKQSIEHSYLCDQILH